MSEASAYVGLDVHKDTISVAIAEAGRDGEIRLWGRISHTPPSIDNMLKKITARHSTLEFAFEAGPTGFGLYRNLTAKGHVCRVIAPSRHTPQAGRSHQK